MSKEAGCTWFTQNWVFRWFVGIVSARYASDKELTSELQQIVHVNGVSLDLVYERNEDLALRMQDAFRETADEVSAGIHILPITNPPPEMQEQLKQQFADLVSMLDRCVLKGRDESSNDGV